MDLAAYCVGVPARKFAFRFPSNRLRGESRLSIDNPIAQQARRYAEILGLKFAYATNGPDVIEIDYFTGTEVPRSGYPTPAELWSRYRAGVGLASDQAADQLLTPFTPPSRDNRTRRGRAP